MENRFTKRYYRVREATEIIGVPATTLRFWESEFPELKPERTPHNQRLYTPANLELLQIIHFLLYTKGFKLEAAKEYLRHNKKNVSKKIKVISKLTEVREDLSLLLKSLNIRGNNEGLSEIRERNKLEPEETIIDLNDLVNPGDLNEL